MSCFSCFSPHRKDVSKVENDYGTRSSGISLFLPYSSLLNVDLFGIILLNIATHFCKTTLGTVGSGRGKASSDDAGMKI